MVRAIIRSGEIRAMDPLPRDWREGQRVTIEVEEADAMMPDASEWYREVQEGSSRVAAQDHECFEAAVREIRREAKDQMRHEMGLDRR